MANEYVTTAELKATLSLTGETYADADLALAAEAASRLVDGVCRRRFWKDADALQVRYYDATDDESVRIDDLVNLTALAVDADGTGAYAQTWTLNTHFTVEPVNASADGKPIERVLRHPLSEYRFPLGWPQPVKVTGRFGWPAVPPAVKHATGILASRLLKRAREAPLGIVSLGIDAGSGTLHAARISRTDPDIQGLLQPFMRGGRRFV